MKIVYQADDGAVFAVESACFRHDEFVRLAQEIVQDCKARGLPAPGSNRAIIEVFEAIDRNSNWLLQNIDVRPA